METKYYPRIIDKKLESGLKLMGALCIEGVKYCGKTRTCEHFAKTSFKFQEVSKKDLYKNYVFNTNEKIFDNEVPILIDEWQEIPEIWDLVRNSVDEKKGPFLLTGSSSAKEGIVSHTGTGRIGKLKMRTMSLYESGDSSGEVSIAELFKKNINIAFESPKEIKDIAYYIIRGGWPDKINANENDAIEALEYYYKSLINSDIQNIDGVKRNPNTANLLLKSFSRNISTLAKYTTILEDMKNNGNEISAVTLDDYVNTFEKLYVIENIKAWSPKIRSKYAIRTADKKELVDPSLACISLGITSDYLINDWETFGFMFESLVLRDLRIYIESLGGEIYHYKDQSELEVDAILTLKDGSWGAVEVKLGSSPDVIKEASNNLKALSDTIDTKYFKKPSFLMVVTGGKYAYKTDEGIFVVPITLLKN
jgi:predicted AAA+ superfamily ATPase